MYRIPNQFDPRAQATLSAAGGGSTSTTCSSCVVTLGVAVLGPVVLFSQLAASQPPEAVPAADVPAPARLSKTHAILWGLAVPVGALTLPGGLLLALGGSLGLGLLVMLTLGAWVCVFAHVYERTQGRSGKGVGIGIASLVGLVVMAAIEMAVWLQF